MAYKAPEFARVYRALGYHIRFCWYHPVFEKMVDAVVLPDWQDASSVGGVEADCSFTISGTKNCVCLKLDGDTFLNGADFSSSEDRLRRACQLHLATHCHFFTFLHAGVVANKTGVVLLPGRTGAGKSTLVKALVESGFTYYSDEFAVVQGDGKVRCFPRPLRERLNPSTFRFQSAADCGWSPATPARPVSLVLFTTYGGEFHWSPLRMSRGEALLRLLEHTVAARLRPKSELLRLRALLATARAFHSERGEAGPVVTSLQNMLKKTA